MWSSRRTGADYSNTPAHELMRMDSIFIAMHLALFIGIGSSISDGADIHQSQKVIGHL